MGLLTQGGSISKRAHKRFAVEFPMEVYGKDDYGHVFTTTGVIRDASSNGGCIKIDKDLSRGQILRLVSSNGVVFPARICWESYNPRTNQRLFER